MWLIVVTNVCKFSDLFDSELNYTLTVCVDDGLVHVGDTKNRCVQVF